MEKDKQNEDPAEDDGPRISDTEGILETNDKMKLWLCFLKILMCTGLQILLVYASPWSLPSQLLASDLILKFAWTVITILVATAKGLELGNNGPQLWREVVLRHLMMDFLKRDHKRFSRDSALFNRSLLHLKRLFAKLVFNLKLLENRDRLHPKVLSELRISLAQDLKDLRKDLKEIQEAISKGCKLINSLEEWRQYKEVIEKVKKLQLKFLAILRQRKRKY